MKRRFRVTVSGKVFDVEVEEVGTVEPVATPATTVPIPREEKKPSPAIVSEAKAEVSKAPGTVRAPIPGTIVSIKCKEGDVVKTGDPILVLESMKMENLIYSPITGKIKKIYVSEGASVNAGEVLVEIE